MIGETGAGKSSFLNTFVTALANSKERRKIARESPLQSREESATKRVQCEHMINKSQISLENAVRRK